MSLELTTKQALLFEHIKRAGEVRGVYTLAKAVGRPYKRVLEHLHALQAAGKIDLISQMDCGRRITMIRASAGKSQPELSYSRIWSSPITGVNDTVLIASVLAEPTFDDVLTCCRHYGVARVREVYTSMLGTDEMGRLVQKSVGRMLANIEIGFARAA